MAIVTPFNSNCKHCVFTNCNSCYDLLFETFNFWTSQTTTTQAVWEELDHSYTFGASDLKEKIMSSKNLLKNFKNIAKTLVKKHQAQLAFHFWELLFPKITVWSNLRYLGQHYRRWTGAEWNFWCVVSFHHFLGQKLWHRVSSWDACGYWSWKWDAFIQQDGQCNC